VANAGPRASGNGFRMFFQRTIQKEARVEGIGLHTGAPCSLTFRPAPVDTGIYFVRSDLPGRPALKASAHFVKATAMATVLGGEAFSVSTVEHCLSALSAFRIDNLFVELDGPEIPIVDGSAHFFAEALVQAGFYDQDKPRRYLYVTQPVYYGDGGKYGYVLPYHGLKVTCTIEFPNPAIGRQSISLDVNEQSFLRELSRARTFGFLKDVEALRARGLARGGDLSNAVVLDSQGVMNSEGLRYPDEFVRHKALDALGDLVTLGHPLMGHVVLFKAGHDMMNRLIRLLLESTHAYRWTELGPPVPVSLQDYSRMDFRAFKD
jgi:UDP-3-O-[3-hydroxymyristoyl] N-acetylglucosamine deacetylase